MLHGSSFGRRGVGRLGSLNADPTGVNPYITDVTNNAGYLMNWYNQLFPSQQTQTVVPVPTAQTGMSSTTMMMLLGGVGLMAFMYMKK